LGLGVRWWGGGERAQQTHKGGFEVVAGCTELPRQPRAALLPRLTMPHHPSPLSSSTTVHNFNTKSFACKEKTYGQWSMRSPGMSCKPHTQTHSCLSCLPPPPWSPPPPHPLAGPILGQYEPPLWWSRLVKGHWRAQVHHAGDAAAPTRPGTIHNNSNQEDTKHADNSQDPGTHNKQPRTNKCASAHNTPTTPLRTMDRWRADGGCTMQRMAGSAFGAANSTCRCGRRWVADLFYLAAGAVQHLAAHLIVVYRHLCGRCAAWGRAQPGPPQRLVPCMLCVCPLVG
jgi:hypothetical protein